MKQKIQQTKFNIIILLACSIAMFIRYFGEATDIVYGLSGINDLVIAIVITAITGIILVLFLAYVYKRMADYRGAFLVLSVLFLAFAIPYISNRTNLGSSQVCLFALILVAILIMLKFNMSIDKIAGICIFSIYIYVILFFVFAREHYVFPRLDLLCELVAAIILMLPYIIIYKKILKKFPKKLNIRALGGLFFCPLFLFYGEYGSICFAITMYYILIIMAGFMANQEDIIDPVKKTLSSLYTDHSWTILLLLYPIILMPMERVHIFNVTIRFVEDILAVSSIL